MGWALPMRNPVFGRFWLARLVSYAGSQISVVALTLYVVEATGSGVAVGLLLLADTLPRLFGPLAGAVVDRVDARRLMISCDLGQAALIGAIALFVPPFPAIVALVAGASALSTLFFPAGRSAVPSLVEERDLAGANALIGSAANLSFALGPALGALLFAAVGVQGALALDALSFVVSAGLLLRLPALRPAHPETPPAGLLGDLRDGLVYVARHAAVRAVVVGLLLGVVFLGLDAVALPFLAQDSLGVGGVWFGVLVSAHGAGMILGPLLLLRRRLALVAPASLILLGLALEGFTTLFTGLAPTVALAVALRSVGGIGNGVENVAADTLLQKTVPRAMLGRVFGVYYGGVMLAEGLAYAISGPLVEATSPRVVFVVAGAGTLTTMLLVWQMLPRAPEGPPSLRSRG